MCLRRQRLLKPAAGAEMSNLLSFIAHWSTRLEFVLNFEKAGQLISDKWAAAIATKTSTKSERDVPAFLTDVAIAGSIGSPAGLSLGAATISVDV